MVIIGPVLTILAFSSCLGTLLSGHILGCVTDFAYVAIGGTFFVIGIIMAIVGLVIADPVPYPPTGPGYSGSTPGPVISCKKCGRGYSSSMFFCPSCGQRQG